MREIFYSILFYLVVFDYFLFLLRDVFLNKLFGFCEDLGVCLIEGLCSILVEVKFLLEELVFRSLDGYFDKCVNFLFDKIYVKRVILVLFY